MRLPGLFTCMLLAGCSGVSTVPLSSLKVETSRDGGVGYVLPKGMVPVMVFADTKGIGLTIDPAVLVGDSSVGTLVAQLRPSALNNENFKFSVDPATSFLTSVTSDSEAQLIAIFQEIGKTAGRLAFENAKATALKEKVVVMNDTFDPLSPSDVLRINESINAAVRTAEGAFAASGRRTRLTRGRSVALTVHHADGLASVATTTGNLDGCRIGVCTRTMTSRTIRVSIGGNSVMSKTVALPTTEVIPVPVPQVILADQNLAITIENGILKQYNMDRKSELLGLVKIPGAVIGGVVEGITQQLTDRTTIATKTKEALEAEKAVTDAKKTIGKVALENSTASGDATALYTSRAETIYLHSETLAEAIRALKEPSGPRTPPTPGNADGDLIPPPQGSPPGAS